MSPRACLPLLLLPLLAACSHDPSVTSGARNLPAQTTAALTPNDADLLLQVHNQARAKAGVPPLQWSPRIARNAQDWANRLGERCRLSGNQETSYGENLFQGSAYHLRPSDAAVSWEKSGESYQGQPVTRDNLMVVGKYTQMIWSRTRAVGCGVAECGGGGQMIVVCNYDPAGNVLGQTPK